MPILKKIEIEVTWRGDVTIAPTKETIVLSISLFSGLLLHSSLDLHKYLRKLLQDVTKISVASFNSNLVILTIISPYLQIVLEIFLHT